MRKLGLLGGMSPESTVLYYQLINQAIQKQLGKNHSTPMIISSVDFEEIVQLQKSANWQQAGQLLAQEAVYLQNSCCDLIALATNTMHKVADDIEQAIAVPFIHLIDATAMVIEQAQLSKVGLLGTKFTMSDGFYHQRINQFHIDLLTPPENKQNQIHNIIFDELCHNNINPLSKQIYLDAINNMIDNGAEGIILGCTEIGILIKQDDILVPCFDSTLLHCQKIAEMMLN